MPLAFNIKPFTGFSENMTALSHVLPHTDTTKKLSDLLLNCTHTTNVNKMGIMAPYMEKQSDAFKHASTE